jgi:uncharacterized protein YeaO (DUF488 family)
MNIKLKRVYETADAADGIRILVDRLWPRGLTRQNACIDFWLKGIAPSTELRTWFAHDPGKWPEFKKRYQQELKKKTQEIEIIEDLVELGNVTLTYAAKDEEHNAAVVLKEALSINNK